jgi:dUTP pyrophosphatase
VQRVVVKVKKLANFRGELPSYESIAASGFDVKANIVQSIMLEPGQRTLVPTGLAVEIPLGYEIQVRPRSGWAIREGLGVLNSPGTIDADYRGEIKIVLINLGQEAIEIRDQDRIAQLVLVPVLQAELQLVDELSETKRNAGGFGSTGK